MGKAEDIRRMIAQLSPTELLRLRQMLIELWGTEGEGGVGGAGVREPRRPIPPADDATAHVLPEDYWETAE